MQSANSDVRQVPGYPFCDVRQVPGYPFCVPPPQLSTLIPTTLYNYGNTPLPNHGTTTLSIHSTTTVPNYGTTSLANHGTTSLANHGNTTVPNHGTTRLPNYSNTTLSIYGTTTLTNHGTQTLQGIRKIPVMEDFESLECVVCSRLAQFAVLTPCCSSLACRMCAITNIIKSQGKCGRCQESPGVSVFLSSLVPHQQVRRKVEEIEACKQLTQGEPVDKNIAFLPFINPINKRAFDHTNDDNKIESKKMNLGNFNHSGLKITEGNITDFPQQVLQAEVVKERIGHEINKNSELTQTIALETENSVDKCDLEACVDKHSQKLIEAEKDNDQSKSEKETFTIKEKELEQLKQFIKYEKDKLNKIKLTFAEEEAKKMIKEKEALFKLVENEQENARKIKRELANKEEELEHLNKDFEDKCQQLKVRNQNIVKLKKIGRHFREKLSSAEEEIKNVLEVNKAMYAIIISLKEEKKKMEEKQQLKSTYEDEPIGTNDIKEDLEQLKNKQQNFSNNNNVQLKKIAKEKLSLAEEEIKWIFDERRTLDATIKSLMEEREKLKEENQNLKCSNKVENIGENGHSWIGKAGDADLMIRNTEAVIPLRAPQIENMSLEMDKIKCSMDLIVSNKRDFDALDTFTLRDEASKHQLVNSNKKLKNELIEELWDHYIKFHLIQLKFQCEKSQQQVQTTSIRKQLFGDFESDSDMSD